MRGAPDTVGDGVFDGWLNSYHGCVGWSKGYCAVWIDLVRATWVGQGLATIGDTRASWLTSAWEDGRAWHKRGSAAAWFVIAQNWHSDWGVIGCIGWVRETNRCARAVAIYTRIVGHGGGDGNRAGVCSGGDITNTGSLDIIRQARVKHIYGCRANWHTQRRVNTTGIGRGSGGKCTIRHTDLHTLETRFADILRAIAVGVLEDFTGNGACGDCPYIDGNLGWVRDLTRIVFDGVGDWRGTAIKGSDWYKSDRAIWVSRVCALVWHSNLLAIWANGAAGWLTRAWEDGAGQVFGVWRGSTVIGLDWESDWCILRGGGGI